MLCAAAFLAEPPLTGAHWYSPGAETSVQTLRMGYLVLAMGTWAIARFRARYRHLPPGSYGTGSGGRHPGRPPDLSGSTPS
ncbi:hypothetical protein [Amycolatopsis sp. lyj-23]|uniref:hypothetical protein n=1 Tax=Amycolatopsis sp. lyj-23 TaxID=2789283 RepID=UPI0039795523